MKTLTVILLMSAVMFSLTGCGRRADAPEVTDAPAVSAEPVTELEPETEAEAKGGKILIAYFSRAGENYGVGVIEKGNTRIIAEMIAEATGGELFEIARVTPYPEDYTQCTQEAKQEQNDAARPKLTAGVEGFEDYDTVFLGYPNWWGDMPMPVYSFLEGYDFSGKTVIPFCTHAGSGLSSTVQTLKDNLTGATVLDGLAITGTTAQNNQSEANEAVLNWLGKMEEELQ